MDVFWGEVGSDLVYLSLADNSARDVAAMPTVLLLVVALNDHHAVALGQLADETNDARGVVPLVNQIAHKDDLVVGRGAQEVN